MLSEKDHSNKERILNNKQTNWTYILYFALFSTPVLAAIS